MLPVALVTTHYYYSASKRTLSPSASPCLLCEAEISRICSCSCRMIPSQDYNTLGCIILLNLHFQLYCPRCAAVITSKIVLHAHRTSTGRRFTCRKNAVLNRAPLPTMARQWGSAYSPDGTSYQSFLNPVLTPKSRGMDGCMCISASENLEVALIFSGRTM